MNLKQAPQDIHPEIYLKMTQGSAEWFALRKTKITATDASVIVGASKWKTKIQLYKEKISEEPASSYKNEAMQRGIDLEPAARSEFAKITGIYTEPAVVVRDWAMASLDGIDSTGHHIVEIKCPGQKDHHIAKCGKVPEHYMPQLQHQMFVCGLDHMYYFSFDGIDGIVVDVERNQSFIDHMVEQELKFYECLISKTLPDPEDDDYIEINDPIWEECAEKWKEVQKKIKELEKQEAHFRKQLIFMSGESNAKGAGVTLCQINRKGNVDYSKIPELLGVNLEPYRKPSTTSWRITSE